MDIDREVFNRTRKTTTTLKENNNSYYIKEMFNSLKIPFKEFGNGGVYEITINGENFSVTQNKLKVLKKNGKPFDSLLSLLFHFDYDIGVIDDFMDKFTISVGMEQKPIMGAHLKLVEYLYVNDRIPESVLHYVYERRFSERIGFGKYSEMSLIEVLHIDRGYIEWVAENFTHGPYKRWFSHFLELEKIMEY